MKVSNQGCIRRLSLRFLLASRTRNIVAVLAIALTAVLFTSLFTIALSINEGIQENAFRQAGGWAHGTFKSLSKEQFDALKGDPLIKEWGVRRFLGMPEEAPFHKSHVEISYCDEKEAQGKHQRGRHRYPCFESLGDHTKGGRAVHCHFFGGWPRNHPDLYIMRMVGVR